MADKELVDLVVSMTDTIAALKTQNTALNAIVYGLLLRMSEVDDSWREVSSGAFDEAADYMHMLLDRMPGNDSFQASLDIVENLRGATVGEIQRRHGI